MPTSSAPDMSQSYNNETRENSHVDPAAVSDALIDPSLAYVFGEPPVAGDSPAPRHNQAPPLPVYGCRTPVAREYGSEEPQSAKLNVPQSGTPRGRFLLGIPLHDYMLPQGGPINATIVDIIVILPQWFRNPGILQRFLNNGITANIQFTILEEYRHLGLTSADQLERARDHISDIYRKQMRRYFDPKWTKQNHRAPADWDAHGLSIHGFFPETVVSGAPYVAPESIPFKDLAIGLKKLPEGTDAGDLTHALNYAMRNQKLDNHGYATDFVFPDDIQLILSAIGRVPVTVDQTDGFIVTRYHNMLREAEMLRRRKLADERMKIADARKQQDLAEQVAKQSIGLHHTPVRQSSQYENRPRNWHILPSIQDSQAPNGFYDSLPPSGMGAPMPAPIQQPRMPIHQTQMHHPVLQDTGYNRPFTNNQNSSLIPEHSLRSASQEAAAEIAAKLASQGTPRAAAGLPSIPDICTFQGDPSWLPLQQGAIAAEEQIDAYVAANQTFDPNDLPQWPMHPAMVLGECTGWFTDDDTSDIARATRWNIAHEDGISWTVGDVGMIIGLLDAAEAGFEELSEGTNRAV